jgi:transposase
MMLVPAGIKVHMAVGYTDLRKGPDGLAVLVEQVLEKDPFSGHMFVFRGKRADMIKVLFWDDSVEKLRKRISLAISDRASILARIDDTFCRL